MNPNPEAISDISKAIQLALGPVFLLTGIAGMLNVMSGRLSRIIDRGRFLTENPASKKLYTEDVLKMQLVIMEKRRRFTSYAITMSTIAALFVCLVIVTLFMEVMFTVRLNWVIGAQFTMAILALVIGLAYFLREVHLAATTIRIEHQQTGLRQ